MSDSETEILKARFVGVNQDTIGKCQIPVEIGEGSELVLQFGDSDMLDTYMEVADEKMEYRREFQSFSDKIKILSDDELNNCLKCCSDDMINLLSTTVSCVGCRRAVETLFQLVSEMDYHTLCPIKLIKCMEHQTSCEFTLEDEYLVSEKRSLKQLFMILYVFKPQLEWVVNVIPKSRKNKRCNLHCLDSHKVKSVGVWMDFWKSLNISSRDEIVTINIDAFVEALDSYLQKHRFCLECKAKVERAYKLLLKEASPENEEDYDGEIFSGIKVCRNDGHLHIDSADETISGLISRAEPELTNSSRRERHAKTMDVAQEEVLTCLGIVLHEKLHKLCQKVKAEEQTWMILVNTCLECLKRRLVLAIEEKRGYTNMDLFLLEHEQETKKKELKKEIKREKKRKKKLARKTTSEGASDTGGHSPSKDDFTFDDDDEEEEEREEEHKSITPANINSSQTLQLTTTEESVEDEKTTDWQVVENNHYKQCNSKKPARSQRTCNRKLNDSSSSPAGVHHINNNHKLGEANSTSNAKLKPKVSNDPGSCSCRGAVAGRSPLKPTEKNSNPHPPPSNRSLPKVAVINNNGKRHCSNVAPPSSVSSSLPSSNQFRSAATCQHSCSTESSSTTPKSRPRVANGCQKVEVPSCYSKCECSSSGVNNGGGRGNNSGRHRNDGSKGSENKRNHRLDSSGSHKSLLSRTLAVDSFIPEYSSTSTSTSEETEVCEDFITEQERLYFQDNWANIREQRNLLRSKLRQAWSEKTKAIS